MDLANVLNVRTLNDYIAATETIVKECPDLKIPLNMSTVLNLKKVRSLEIEYFNKYEGNGAAFIVFEHMLKQPPAKTWGLLGKELVTMLQYWLDAVRRHLISHNQHWWSFLKSLLVFIKEIKSKDPSLLSTIVELTTEALLDLASNSTLDEGQRHHILLTVNEYCAESSRELRSRMKDRLAGYFVKLAALLSSSGHLPTQFVILETLLRWLVGRYDPRVREAAADSWFPQDLFRRETVEVFMERSWRDFYQDARDFLISHNDHRPDCVISVVCKKLSAGGVAIIKGPQSRATWLDVNHATRSITVILDCRVTESAPTKYKSYDSLTVSDENVCSVQLYRANSETMLAVQTLEPLHTGDTGALIAQLATARLRALDRALRAAFADKYQVLLNIDAIESSPFSDPNNTVKPCPRKFSSSEEDRPAIPQRRRKHSGFIVRSRNHLTLNSPSTASTTSLAQLHDKLAALPHLLYNKEPVKVSIQPELSVVREVSECEDHSSVNLSQSARSTHVGVCQRQSDSEVNTKKRNFASVGNSLKPTSLILAATIGSNDEEVLRETYDKIYRNNREIDLLDLLVEEAFQEKDSGIITDKKTQDTDVIENTPLAEQVTKKVNQVKKAPKSKCTVVSNSTTDESNTEYLIDMPYVNERKRNATKEKPVIEESKLLDAEAVEAFFSQHISENNAGQLLISPSLAKKINETSSEGSDIMLENPDLNKNDIMIEAEIIDCLNSIVDEVSRNFDKCREILSKELQEIAILGVLNTKNMNEVSPNVPKEKGTASFNTKTKPIKLRLQPAKKRAQRKTKQNAKQKNDIENKVIDASAIEEDNVFIENTNTNSPVNRISTPLIRKKRKLYSPKDDGSDPMDEIPDNAKVQPRINNNDTPIATCYKELEIVHQTRCRMPRKKRASTEPVTSPRTRKLNDMFDKLKEKVENEEKITLVDTKSKTTDLAVYNYTSESEDEDFQKKKTEVKKRVNSTKIESTATKRGRYAIRVKYTESNNSSTDDNSRRVKKRKAAKQSKPRSRKLKVEHTTDLIDERMREPAPEVLEVSFVKETPSKNKIVETEPVIEHAPTMEEIPIEIIDVPIDTISVKSNLKKEKRHEIVQIKKEKSANKTTNKAQESKAVKKGKQTDKKSAVKETSCNKEAVSDSPLPGLVIETEQSRKDRITDPVESTMLQKFQNIYRQVQDVTESVETQNLILRNEEYNICPNINDVNINVFDQPEEEVKNIFTNKAEYNANKVMNTNKNVQKQEERKEDGIMETIVLSDALSEKTIPTDGKSPITGHNDLDELPPSTALLTEHIDHRNLEIQDMSQSMTEFFIQLRDRLPMKSTPSASPENKETSPVLPTRLSSREYNSSTATPKVVLEKIPSTIMGKFTSPSKCNDQTTTMLPTRQSSSEYKSSTATPKVVLEKMPSKIIEKHTSPICSDETTAVLPTRLSSKMTSRSSTVTPKVVLQKMPSKTMEKYTSPSKSSSTRSPEIVLERISSDEINKWLPIPCTSKFTMEEEPKRYNTRNAVKKAVPVKKTPEKKLIDKIKSSISPIRLSFDINNINENTGALRKENTSANDLRSKDLTPPASKVSLDLSKESVKLDSQNDQEVEIPDIICSGRGYIQNSSSEYKSSAEEKARIEKGKDKSATDKVEAKCALLSEGNKSISSVNEWFRRNIATSSTSKDDTNIGKEILERVMETLETTLGEIQLETGKNLASMLVENQRSLNALRDECRSLDERVVAEIMELAHEKWAERDRRLREMMELYQRGQKERAVEITRTVNSRTTLMVKLLKEDLQATLEYNSKK